MKKFIKKPPIFKGFIEYWNEKKGYGFIKAENLEQSIYFHINAYGYKNRRPKKGDKVVLFLNNDSSKVSAARVVGKEHQNLLFTANYCDLGIKKSYLETSFYSVIALTYFLILFMASPLIGAISLLLSILSFGLIYYDKIASITNQSRIPNATLYVAAILGAWTGILIARTVYKHKIRTQRFVVFFSATITINCFLVILLTKLAFSD